MMPEWTDPNTGQSYDRNQWIIYEQDGMVTRKKRLSPKQLAYIESLEYQLGYKPRNHFNVPAYKASKMINRLQELVNKHEAQTKINLD